MMVWKYLKKKIDFKDKRHWKNEFEKGIYVNHKIENVEKDEGLIDIGNKKYRVLFMAKVKINEILEPENDDFWVLDKKFIEFYLKSNEMKLIIKGNYSKLIIIYL